LCSGFFFSELQPLLQKAAQRCKGIRGKAGHQQGLPVQLCWSICVRCTKGLLHIALSSPSVYLSMHSTSMLPKPCMALISLMMALPAEAAAISPEFC